MGVSHFLFSGGRWGDKGVGVPARTVSDLWCQQSPAMPFHLEKFFFLKKGSMIIVENSKVR